MSIIKGNFRYLKAYSSVKDLVSDSDIESGYVVMVLSNQTLTIYEVSQTKGSAGFSVSNSLYCNPIFSGNSQSEGISQLYSTNRPVSYDVGGVSIGVS